MGFGRPYGAEIVEGPRSQGSRPLARISPWAILDRSYGAQMRRGSLDFHCASQICSRRDKPFIASRVGVASRRRKLASWPTEFPSVLKQLPLALLAYPPPPEREHGQHAHNYRRNRGVPRYQIDGSGTELEHQQARAPASAPFAPQTQPAENRARASQKLRKQR